MKKLLFLTLFLFAFTLTKAQVGTTGRSPYDVEPSLVCWNNAGVKTTLTHVQLFIVGDTNSPYDLGYYDAQNTKVTPSPGSLTVGVCVDAPPSITDTTSFLSIQYELSEHCDYSAGITFYTLGRIKYHNGTTTVKKIGTFDKNYNSYSPSAFVSDGVCEGVLAQASVNYQLGTTAGTVAVTADMPTSWSVSNVGNSDGTIKLTSPGAVFETIPPGGTVTCEISYDPVKRKTYGCTGFEWNASGTKFMIMVLRHN